MKKEQKNNQSKNLKDYWDSRHEYIREFCKKNWDRIKRNMYLLISVSVFLFALTVLGFFFSMGIKNLFLLCLFVCFFICLFVCLFVCLPRFFKKQGIVRFTSIMSLVLAIIFTLWTWSSIFGPGGFRSLPSQWEISFMRFFYSFNPFYAFLLLSVISIISIIFSFSKERRFKGKKGHFIYVLFVVFVIFLICVPYWIKNEPKLQINIVGNKNGWPTVINSYKFY